MHFDIEKRTIFLARHGSFAYGLNVATSDEDFKGVCVKPKECYFGFVQKFEQFEHMGSKSDGIDKVVYALDKFTGLAAACNPNIVEVLHVADEDVLFINEFGEQLRSIRNDFISKAAKFTFTGYAHAQLKRIKTHRSWLLNPPTKAPTRADFKLSETTKVSASELGAFQAAVNDGMEIDLPKDVLTLFTREKQYQAAKAHYDQYLGWVKSRNPARAALEAKFGYDTKHGMHLLRLQTMGVEILRDHVVNVKRTHDKELLLSVRNGGVSYDELIERAEALELECNVLYETSTLRKEPDRKKLDAFIVDLTERYLRKHG